MNRKQKIALLNGLLKGEKPMACIFSEWPEKTYYCEDAEEDIFTTEDGKIISLEDVDHELMNYPKVRIIYKEPEKEVKVSHIHKYINEDGEEIEMPDGYTEGAVCPIKKPPGPQIQEHEDLTTFEKLSNLNVDTNPPPDPKPPPEPFLSRKDRDVMAQGPLYCLR